MAFADSINPDDQIRFALSRSPEANELPARLSDPQGHEVERHTVSVERVWRDGHGEIHTDLVTIPFYVCAVCTVVYRYHECTLMPGDEGLP